MAYNPFDFFRRNQKILFAVLTVFIMVMFTLQTGAANDFFQWFPRWLGSRSSGDVMAVVNGSKVRSSDLYDIQKHRRLANQFMLISANLATNKLATELNTSKNKVSEANRPLFEKILRERQPLRLGEIAPPPYVDFMQLIQSGLFQAQLSPADMTRAFFSFQQQNVMQLRMSLNRVATGNNVPKDDLDAVKLAQILMGLDLAPFQRGDVYFTDAPNATDKDTLDFMLWKLKADQLGIKFTREDVEQLVDVEFEVFDAEARTKVLQSLVDEKRGITANSIYAYLADEFRVRAAQQAVLGSTFIRAGTPAPVSPDQTFNLFKEATDGARWSMATLSVDFFLNQVQGAPTGQEIQDIYRKGQNIEPDPTLSRPAFKKPRELKVGWLEITGKEPYYDAASKEAVAKLETSVNASNFLVVPFAGGPLSQIAGLGIATVSDKLLLEEYNKYKTNETEKGSSWFVNGATEANMARPENAALLLGNASFNPLTAVLVPQIRAERMDDTHRVAAQLPPLAGALLGGPASLSSALLVPLVCQDKYPAQVAPKPLPLSAVRSTLIETVRQTFQNEKLPKADLEKLMADTKDAVTNNPNDKTKGREAAKKILDTFVATRKLADLKQVGESKDYADQYSVSKDPNLERLLVRFAGPHAGLDNVEGFGRVFFYDIATTGLNQQTKEVDSQRFFTPRTYPEPTIGNLRGQSQYLVWLTSEIPAATRRLEEAKDAVVMEWRRQKARALAKVAADELAAKVATLKPDPAVLALSWPELARVYGPPALMPEMAGQLLQPLPGSSGGYDFVRYPWPRLIVKYPTLEMQKALMENRNKPYGTALVLTDQPESAYYVAVLVDRVEKNSRQYADIVYAPIATGRNNPAGMQLPGLFSELARRADIQEALELLRSEFGYKDENPKVNEKQNKGE